MKYDDFLKYLNSIRPNSERAASVWNDWAKELEGYDSSDGEIPEGEYKTAEMFFDEFADRFQSISDRYGKEITAKVISLADISACLFPWEMKRAAEFLADGGSIDDIPEMMRDGTLEDFSDDIPKQSM